jgi:ABC-type tungstate transport system permease subunit
MPRRRTQKFVADGFGVKRYAVMYNDFVFIGPNSYPAGIKGTNHIMLAVQAHRGEVSSIRLRNDGGLGTYIRELELRKAAGIDMAKDRVRSKVTAQFSVGRWLAYLAVIGNRLFGLVLRQWREEECYRDP